MAGTITASTSSSKGRGLVRIRCTLVTDASGDATATIVGSAFGRIVGFLYNGGLDASAVITVTDSQSGAAVLAYTTGTEGTPVHFRPTKGIFGPTGAAVTAAATAVDTNRDIFVAGPLKVTVASGGNVETGIISLLIEEAA
jgi:hypothetical protein